MYYENLFNFSPIYYYKHHTLYIYPMVGFKIANK